jgi:catechol 2,3-dioxygenase-like lactoylglutathione lyase family enzyme
MRVHHIALRTRHVEALVAFYRELLRLPVVREQPGYSVWLGLEQAVLMIERADEGEPATPAATRELLAFAVEAAERSRIAADLQARGLAVEERTAHTLYFRDPDGRRVGVSTYPLPELTRPT